MAAPTQAPAIARLPSPAAAAAWLAARVVGTLRSDSRAVRAGDGFVAWPGAATDGRRHVAAALAAGASACLVEDDGVDAFGFADARIASLAGLKAAAGAVADAVCGHPSRRLSVIATTGTNGKTSTAWWTAQSLTALGRRCAVVGTLGIGDPPPIDTDTDADAGADAGAEAAPARVETGLTTPDPVTLHAALRDFADGGRDAVAIEASSIGLAEHRLDATRIEVALFTNFTRDHLDYHGDMDAYWAAKRALFDWPGLRAAVVDIDDERGAALADDLQGGAVEVWTVSRRAPARLRAGSLSHDARGIGFDLVEGGASAAVRSRLVGDYNVSNLLAVVGALRAMGVSLADAAATVSRVAPVPGRMQRVAGPADAPAVIVDYAHTPDALAQVLAALRPLADARGGRLWCVFGCGGDRDATKRPLMGAIAARGADRVVITSDNPRREPPAAILAQILAGVAGHDEVAVIEDRREAIAHAIGSAAAGDVVVVAGKGHEATQDIGGTKLPFSDTDEAARALRDRRGSPA